MVRFASTLALLAGLAPLTRTADEVPESPYYPLKVGTTWTYGSGDDRTTMKVVKHERVGGRPTALVEVTNADGSRLTENVAVNDAGVYRVAAGGHRIDPPLLLLRLPPKPGGTWAVKSKVLDGEMAGTFTSRAARVKVPAGEYEAVTAESDDLRMGDAKFPIKYYFAKGVGMVKQVVKVGDEEVVLELEKFEAGK
jgi:hypothetical protein